MRFLIFLLAILIAQPARAELRYEDLVKLSEQHQARVKQDGINYALGGTIGLGLSVGLGIRTKEALPKLGYSLIQVLSSAAIAHGASLYYQGDGLTREGERLKVFAEELDRQGLSAAQKKKILDQVTTELVRKEITRYRELRKIRGYLELTSAVASGLTLGLSKSKSSASNSALGFIVLISLVGAYSDLLGSGATPETMKELYSWSIAPSPDQVHVAWGISW